MWSWGVVRLGGILRFWADLECSDALLQFLLLYPSLRGSIATRRRPILQWRTPRLHPVHPAFVRTGREIGKTRSLRSTKLLSKDHGRMRHMRFVEGYKVSEGHYIR